MSDQYSDSQKQTEDTFGYKWRRRETYESDAMRKALRHWLFEKYFDGDESRLSALLAGRQKRILDAGCGSGFSAMLLFGEHLRSHLYFGVDISDAVSVAQQRFAEHALPGTFHRCDLHAVPETFGQFDIILSEGVLHHTDSVQTAIATLSRRLEPGGTFLFYLYAKKAPIREFTDDLVRDAISRLDHEAAWKALEPLTRLGKRLGELNVELDVDEDIPYLGITKGRHNLHRLFYYTICKAFYRPEYTIEEMNHINFDWFRPRNCHRHTPEEVKTFCDKAGLSIHRLHVEPSGITVIAERPL